MIDGSFASDSTVSELGERGLIARLIERIGAGPPEEMWSGDDAAVIKAPSGSLLTTIDMLVEGVDYDLRYATAADVGWKGLTAGISDCAAMGGRATHCVAALALRADTPVTFADGILEGLLEAADQWDVALVGGDVSRASETSLTVAVIGVAERAVYRSGASEGDTLCVTGSLGGAAAGLRALRDEIAPAPNFEEALTRLRERQLRPRARVAEGIALAAAGASAMIDVSDGLGMDLGRLLTASDYGCEVDLARIPIDPNLEAIGLAGIAGLDAMALALTGGEDFELLAALPAAFVDRARSAIEATGGTLTSIGTVTAGEARVDGKPLREWEEAGWNHLRHA